MTPRDRFMISLVVVVVAAGAVTVALGTAIATTGGFQGPEAVLMLPLLLVAVLVVWLINRRR